MTDLERQLSRELASQMGPIRHVDDGAIFRAITARNPRRRFHTTFNLARFVIAVGIVALAAGLLLVASPAPPDVQPVDWVTIEGDPPFVGNGHSGSDYLMDVAVAPSGVVVIVGAGRSSGLAWSNAAGDDWRRNTLATATHSPPARQVIPTIDGFVAIGRGHPANDDGSHAIGLIWASRDGVDWSDIAVDGAEFLDVDSVGDTVAILGTLQNVPTVWTSRSGGPWETTPIAAAGSGFAPDQLALSPDGVYLVLDLRTGLAQRSDDGIRFTSVDLPDGPQVGNAGRLIAALVRVADGFALVGRPGADADKWRIDAWRSSDGREWRPGEAAPGLAVGIQLGSQGAATQMVEDVADPDSAAQAPYAPYLSYLRPDGTWCAVSAPAAPDEFSPSAMAWNDDGTLVITGPRLPGAPVAWYATGVRCDR